MQASFEVGQEVQIKPVVKQGPSLRESVTVPYAGKTGVITNYYWMAPPSGEIFYLYTVRINNSNKEIVLYEDEITGTSKATHTTHSRPATR